MRRSACVTRCARTESTAGRCAIRITQLFADLNRPGVRWRLGLFGFPPVRGRCCGQRRTLARTLQAPVAEVAVEPGVVVPVDPAERGELDVFDAPPWPGASRAADQLGLSVAVDGLGQRVVETVADGSDGGDRADLGEPLAVAQRRELRPVVAVAVKAIVSETA